MVTNMDKTILKWALAAAAIAVLAVIAESKFDLSLEQPPAHHKTKQHGAEKDDAPHKLVRYQGVKGLFGLVVVSFVRYAEPLLAAGTLLLAGYTVLMYRDARDKGRRELRAYVAIPADGLSIERNDNGELVPRMRIVNFGRTPAYRTNLRAGIARNASERTASRMHDLIIGHVLSPMNHAAVSLIHEDAVPTTPNNSFCIHGEIDYTDIYGLRWRHFFVWEWGEHGEPRRNWMPHTRGNHEALIGDDPERGA